MGRRLGQHFLKRESVLRRIAEVALPEAEDAATVIEIGPGRGALTAHLLTNSAKLVAIEIDQVLVHYLAQKFKDPKLLVIHGDVLQVDLHQWGRVVVAGNLPYYVTSPIIERVLALRNRLVRAVFLVQKEVAERLTAKPGTREYGYLSVQTQLLADVTLLLPVPAAAFHPSPKVDSAVVLFEPRSRAVDDLGAFLKFASACFRQKRKTLRNNLIGAYDRGRVESLPEASLRAEQLSIEQLLNAYQRILNG